jgi:hypothetical protein
MADLAGQHGDLSAMMRIVGDQIAEKSGDIGTKASNPPVAFE